MTDGKYRLRIAILVGIPLLLAALAGVVNSNTGSAALYYAAVVALGVMLIESLQEVRRSREKEAKASTETVPSAQLQGKLSESEAANNRLKSRLGEWEAENYRLRGKLAEQEQKAAEQETKLAEATNDRRLASLMRYIGDSTPPVAEMSLNEPQMLNGWFDLVAPRIQNASTSGYAGIVLLKEDIDWSESEGKFVEGYKVMFSGGAREFGLERETLLPSTSTVEAALLTNPKVGSAYVSEFSFDERPFWLCILLSTSARHDYLDTLSRAMVSVVLAALASSPPEPARPQIVEQPPESPESPG